MLGGVIPMNESNLPFIEYQLLWDEAKRSTRIAYHDFRLVFPVFTASLVFAASETGVAFLNNWWLLGIAQFVLFVLLLLHASRLAYLCVIRKHLGELEKKLSEGENRLVWESTIVPQYLANPRKISWQIDFLLLAIYALSFLLALIYSFILMRKTAQYNYYYLSGVSVEILVLVYLGVRLVREYRP